MEKEFWLERWERAEIGFHQDDINPWLARYWPRLAAPPGSKVFVPLCGKSLDMAWLRKNRYFPRDARLRGYFDRAALGKTDSSVWGE